MAGITAPQALLFLPARDAAKIMLKVQYFIAKKHNKE
jgi:hypothetical protein